ncbi:hypothetical protein GORHZ_217_00090 [Gordonia rhizosphera NBRC 16068]|uniref:Lipoprotein n=2 Tax=Gordonia rhizosphera TaxID=83341 RepID=K6WHZ0_9ACTN|nr:hypothetical protein GORHZ_217_00090 [Gordonia rhizosphera NBRC 16068]
MRNVAVAIAFLGAALGGLLVGCSSAGPFRTAGPPSTVTVRHTVTAAPPTITNAAPSSASDADAHGFFVFGEGARCLGDDNAEMYMRTEKSALVVCRSETNDLYYRGYRMSDGATIDLYDVYRQPGGFVAVNAPDNARYVITRDGFQLIQNGTVVLNESAVEVGPEQGVQAPVTQAASMVVLGSTSGVGPDARGYGTEQPAVISMGSCPNAISQIVWRDWGASVAHGSGLGCVQTGQPPRYALVASDIGMCQGVLAYRTLQISTNPPQDICHW